MNLTKPVRNAFALLPKRQWQILTMFFGTITLMLVTTSCSAAWIGEAQQIVTTVTTIISSIGAILGLFGAAVSPTVIGDITQASTDVNAELGTVGTLLTEYQAKPSTGLLSSILNALTVAQTNLTTLLANVQITNAALQTKIGAILTLAINAVKELISLVPVPTATMAELHAHYNRITDFFNSAPLKKLKGDYNTILSTPSGDPDVDAACAKLPKL